MAMAAILYVYIVLFSLVHSRVGLLNVSATGYLKIYLQVLVYHYNGFEELKRVQRSRNTFDPFRTEIEIENRRADKNKE